MIATNISWLGWSRIQQHKWQRDRPKSRLGLQHPYQGLNPGKHTNQQTCYYPSLNVQGFESGHQLGQIQRYTSVPIISLPCQFCEFIPLRARGNKLHVLESINRGTVNKQLIETHYRRMDCHMCLLLIMLALRVLTRDICIDQRLPILRFKIKISYYIINQN